MLKKDIFLQEIVVLSTPAKKRKKQTNKSTNKHGRMNNF